jgi:hypothetical protein
MDRVLKETKVKQRFAEQDIRAKVGSELETIEQAQRLLGHVDPRVTKKHYRRKAQIVRPRNHRSREAFVSELTCGFLHS